MVGLFSAGVEAALRASLLAHEGQTRKGDATPYITHPFHVALLLARSGADDVTIQAGLLHDVVEDCEGWTPERVAAVLARRCCGLTLFRCEVRSASAASIDWMTRSAGVLGWASASRAQHSFSTVSRAHGSTRTLALTSLDTSPPALPASPAGA